MNDGLIPGVDQALVNVHGSFGFCVLISRRLIRRVFDFGFGFGNCLCVRSSLGVIV